jgi:hypothetical protein
MLGNKSSPTYRHTIYSLRNPTSRVAEQHWLNWYGDPGGRCRATQTPGSQSSKPSTTIGSTFLGFVALQTELIGSGLYIELIDWPAFLRLSDVAYQTDVPTFVPNYQTPVIDPVTGDQTGWTRLAWSEWKNENQTHLTSDVTGDGFNYIPLWSGNNGNHLALSVLKQIVDAGGFVVV